MSYVVQASLFAGGLVVGASSAVLLTSNRKPIPAPPVEQPTPTSTPGQPALASATSSSSLAVVDSGYASSDSLGPAGYPGPVADFLRHAAYVSSYDRRLRHPSWTAEHITAASLQRPPGSKPDRSNSVFKEDPRIPELFRAKLADYFRSGYDRGHMVPAADAKGSQLAMDETFFLTNMAPQVGQGMNRDYWAHTEDFVRRLTGKFAHLYVFTIPLYLPRQYPDGKFRVSYEVIGNPPNVSVPTHFAKVILGVGTAKDANGAPGPKPEWKAIAQVGLSAGAMALGAFVMPNSVIPNEAPLESFAVPIETVERAAGLTLFPPAIKASSKRLCDTVQCSIVVREFSDKSKTLSAPAAKPLASPRM
ncbi:probable NUC1 - dna/rna non-specific nuclease, mitochondrial [Melanopsichium pennsylvanicum]|uniref:Endonuclease n=2 Tax=Melanopsichium pennsylvanicum TaxID=63383 RepID=A0AAJ5C7E6_9BASI|nr:probable NUC1-dna/rna non-specific nuclease, mitochondrial [Melanopsichium pennsylvanicum 4]SNX86837.1 probable NUC1 - dna/rna non-specific nuclease, mitochondrial [Melanopsichium pennsylvanicum]